MPRKDAIARMTPEQLELERSQRRAWKAANVEKIREQRKRYRERHKADIAKKKKDYRARNPWQKKAEKWRSYQRKLAARANAERTLVAERIANAAKQLFTPQLQRSFYEHALQLFNERLPPDEACEAASTLFIAVMEGQIAVDFGKSDVDAVAGKFLRFNFSKVTISIFEPEGDRTVGERLGLWS